MSCFVQKKAGEGGDFPHCKDIIILKAGLPYTYYYQFRPKIIWPRASYTYPYRLPYMILGFQVFTHLKKRPGSLFFSFSLIVIHFHHKDPVKYGNFYNFLT